MSLKNAVTAGLLLFVAVAVITVVAKSSTKSDSLDATSASQARSNDAGDSSVPTDGLVATFFHGETRCPTCRKIENYAHTALDETFAGEIRSGEIQWRTANYEAPENRQVVKDYKVFTSTVVLVSFVHGKPTDWRNLNRVWDLVDDEEAFKDYVQMETQKLLSH